MFKFLRKYNKWILAVGGGLLMVVFLIGGAIQGLSQQSGVQSGTWATIGPEQEKVSARELQDAQREMRLMTELSIGVGQLGLPEDTAHWYLLKREAAEAGFDASGGRVLAERYIQAIIAQQPEAGIDDTDQAITNLTMTAVQRGQRVSRSFVVETIAKVQAVQEYMAMLARPTPVSPSRLRRFAERYYETAVIRPVVIEARAALSELEPSERRMEDHLALYADVAPGEGDHGFGYRLPDRVKLEWLRISADAVRQTVLGSGEIDELALRRHWIENADRFGEASDGPVPDAVRSDLVAARTMDMLDEIVQFAEKEIRKRHRGLERSAGYLVLPEDWPGQRLSFETLAQQIAERFEIELPVYRTEDRWLDGQAVAELEVLGRTTTDRFGETRQPLAVVAMSIREVNETSSMLVQEGIALPPMEHVFPPTAGNPASWPGADYTGDRFLVRAIDSDPSRPPRSLDEVRDEVERDLRRLDHYERLLSGLDAIERQAETEGLLALALAHDTFVQRQLANVSLTNPQFRSIPTLPPRFDLPTLPVVGQHEPTTRAIVEHVLALPKETPVDELDEAQRVVVVPVDDALAIFVARLMSRTPATQETYEEFLASNVLQQKYMLVENAAEEDEEAGAADWLEAFRSEAMRERHAFVPTRGEEDVEDEDVAGESGDGEASPEDEPAEP